MGTSDFDLPDRAHPRHKKVRVNVTSCAFNLVGYPIEVAKWVDLVQLTGLNKGEEDCPSPPMFLAAHKERILPCPGDWPD